MSERGEAEALARGASLGRYLVIDRIGQGGMGVVYSAHDPELDRQVAIKLLRPDRGGAAAAESRRSRLQREAQAMARLSHPNVITVHDVGTSGDQVFVAMELVDGMTLKRWLADKRPWREVLDVFVQAGRGLAAAHDAGLVHRDFKPDNVLVGKDGAVRVTDFGLARSAGEEGEPPSPGRSPGAAAKLTETGVVMGTPAYMAPEQHRGRAADARADQFAFCVALYEGLFGEHPFRQRVSETNTTIEADSPEAREEVSPADALALDVVAGRIRPPPRSSDVPARVTRAVLRGLAPDPDQRHAGMRELLAGLVRDPTSSWRRLVVIVSAAAAAALAVALVLAVRGRRAIDPCAGADQRIAEAWDARVAAAMQAAFEATGRPYAADTATRVRVLLDDYAARWAATRRDTCLATRVRGDQSERLLDLRMQCLDRRRSELAALAQAFVRGADGETVDQAVPAASGLTPIEACADAAGLTAALPLPDAPAARAAALAVEGLLDQAQANQRTGKYKAALPLAALAASLARPLGHPPTLARALYLLSVIRRYTGDHEAAEADASQAIRAAAEARATDLEAHAWAQLFDVMQVRARYDQAIALRPAAEAAGARAGSLRLQLKVASAIANVLYRQAKHAEVEALLRPAVERGERELPAEDETLIAVTAALARTLHAAGKSDEALAAQRRVLAAREKTLGPDHPLVATPLTSLGLILNDTGKYAEARPLLERALTINERAFGPDNPEVAYAVLNLGATVSGLGDLDGNLKLQVRALAIREQALGADHPQVALSHSNVGHALNELHRYKEALTHLETALAIREKKLGPDHPGVAWTLTHLAETKTGLGDCAAAIELYRRAVAIREAKLGNDNPLIASPLCGIGICLAESGKPAEAVAPLERALALLADESDPGLLAMTRFELAKALRRLGRTPGRAVELAGLARAYYLKLGGSEGTSVAEIDAWLAAGQR